MADSVHGSRNLSTDRREGARSVRRLRVGMLLAGAVRRRARLDVDRSSARCAGGARDFIRAAGVHDGRPQEFRFRTCSSGTSATSAAADRTGRPAEARRRGSTAVAHPDRPGGGLAHHRGAAHEIARTSRLTTARTPRRARRAHRPRGGRLRKPWTPRRTVGRAWRSRGAGRPIDRIQLTATRDLVLPRKGRLLTGGAGQ